MERQSKYNKMPLQTISRKVWSSFIDGLLLLVLGVILTLTAGYGILKYDSNYKSSHSKCFENIGEMYKIQNEAKLQILSKDNNTKVLSTTEYFDFYISKQIKLSYLIFTEDFNNAGITLEVNDDYSRIDNDELAYYFVVYKVEKNINTTSFNDESPLLYFKEDVLFEYINRDYYVDRTDDLPVIKSDIAISLYKYCNNLEKNTNLYNEFSNAVLSIRNIGLADLKTYEVFDSYYSLYSDAYNNMAKYHNYVLLISFSIAFLFLILLPTMLTKDKVTIGKLLTRTRTIHTDDYTIGRFRVLLINIISFVSNAFIIIFISLFSFGLENMKLVIFSLGATDISFLHLLLLSFVFMIGNFFVIVLTQSHRSLIDILTNTKQIEKVYIGD